MVPGDEPVEPPADQVEWLDLDELPPPRAVRPRRLSPRWLVVLVALAAGIAVVVAVTGRHHPKHAAARSSHPSTPGSSTPLSSSVPSSSAPSSSVPPSTAPRPPSRPVVTSLGHPLLGVRDGWELFGLGPTEVVRIEPAAGRVTRTTYPGIMSTGSMSFAVGTHRAIVKPLDQVTGYVVADGEPARPLPDALDSGGLAMPGPAPDQVWVESSGRNGAQLTTLDGRSLGVSIQVPDGFYVPPTSDADGYLLANGVGGTYDARPDGLRRITTGALLAAGPTRWLTLECDEQARCVLAVIDRDSGVRRVLRSASPAVSVSSGIISPDGSTAALVLLGEAGSSTGSVHLIDLASGADHAVPITAREDESPQNLVWSPDSRWLFVCDAGGQLSAVDAHDQSVHSLGVDLPPVNQLAVRTAG